MIPRIGAVAVETEFEGPFVALPREHLVLVAIIGLVLAGVWAGDRALDQRANAANVRQPEPPVLVAQPEFTPPPAPAAVPNLVPPDAPPPPARNVTRAFVGSGDTLSTIFQRHGLTERDLHLVLSSGPLGKRLATIHPGHEFEFEQDADGELVHLTYRLGRLDTVEFDRVGDAFQGAQVVREPDLVTGYRHGVIEQSLFVACQRAGLDDAFAQRLAHIFQWDIDFILDIRNGDEFHVLFHEHHIDGERVAFGDILAVDFINQGDRYTAVRYRDATGAVSYYTPAGENMRKQFLRAPVDFTRISSNFNLRRVHPLWKSSMPHRGIDYAAPRGTKVRAAGDGRVVIAGRTEANGRYIVLKHGMRYQTKYLHLSRIAGGMRPGKAVSQGQIIGYVGATGWATGPHLHYEFLVDGVHKNPRTVPLPQAEAIAEGERRDFKESTSGLLAELESSKSTRQLARQSSP